MPTSTSEDLFTQLGTGFGAPCDGRHPVDARPSSSRRVALAPPVRPSADEPGLPLDTLVDIAVGLAAAGDLWRGHVSHDPVSRTSVRLLSTAAYEVWLLGWTPGQHVDLHDHGSSNAAFVVLDGELDELRLGPGGIAGHRLRAGDVGTVPARAVHDVLNRGTAPATSLHVYADPLRVMTFYELDGSPRFSELVEEVPALVSSAEAGRALHPAQAR